MDANAVGQTIILVMMIIGVIGLIVPGFPGLIIIWAAGLVYGLVTGFTWVSGIIFGVMSVLLVVGNIIDNIVMGASARQNGASWLAIGAAMVGGIAGTLLFPPIGGLIGALLLLFLVEMIRHREWKKAFDSALGLAMGCGWSVLARMGIGTLMVVLWCVWAFALK